MIISPYDVYRLADSHGWIVVDLAAGLVGATPPSAILATIRDADPAAAAPVVERWSAIENALRARAVTIRGDLAELDRRWSGDASTAANSCLDRFGGELSAIADTTGSLAATLEKVIGIVQATQRADEDAGRTAGELIAAAAVSALTAIGIAVLYPAAIPAILAGLAAFLVTTVAALVQFLGTVYDLHHRRATDLGQQVDRLAEIATEPRLARPRPMDQPTLTAVSIEVSIAPVPAVPAGWAAG